MTDEHHSLNHSKHRHVRGDSDGASALLVELREHVPFSVSAVAIGLVVAGALCIVGSATMDRAGVAAGPGPFAHDHAVPEELDGEHAEASPSGHDHREGDRTGDDHGPAFARLFFHLFHPAHMLFSAAATTAMFFRYERRVFKAILIGLIGAIGVCGISDIAMPHASLLILGTPAHLHLCIVEHPSLVLPFAFVGVLVGIGTAGGTTHSTIASHSLHVLASTMASIFYMVGPLGVIAWIDDLGKVFIFVVLAVMIPCCVSDIVFPLLMSRAGRDRYLDEAPAH